MSKLAAQVREAANQYAARSDSSAQVAFLAGVALAASYLRTGQSQSPQQLYEAVADATLQIANEQRPRQN